MSTVPALDLHAKSGLLGALRSWLQDRSGVTCHSSDVAAIESAGPDMPGNESVRILVVDDNPVNLMVISALLEARALVPVLAADGAEAVALVRELHFDLILMDLQMPILDGVGATSAIRRFETSNSRPAVPVIAYSSSHAIARELANFGFSGSLTKPCADQELEDCLVQWCPTYRSPLAKRGVVRESGGWQPVRLDAGTSQARSC
jgi:CheY-like chemotaxis protein